MKPNFSKYPDGLVPTIIQDAETFQVLMLGYMNEEAWEKTMHSDYVTFFSRSKGRLWTKGETSGNFLFKKQIFLDCDEDSILILAEPRGAVCHTGNYSCFGDDLPNHFLGQLERIVLQRKHSASAEHSYTASLFQEGLAKITRKVGEEAIELITAAFAETNDRVISETADLIYHIMVLLAAKEVGWQEVVRELKKRHRTPH